MTSLTVKSLSGKKVIFSTDITGLAAEVKGQKFTGIPKTDVKHLSNHPKFGKMYGLHAKASNGDLTALIIHPDDHKALNAFTATLKAEALKDNKELMKKAKQHDDIYNEGGEGYNPHR